MEFKEQFPSLDLHTWDVVLEKEIKSKEILGQRSILKGDNLGKYVKTKDVIINCLDKQKIKQIIEETLGDDCDDWYSAKLILFKLGLINEDECE